MSQKYPVVLFLYKRPKSTNQILDLIIKANIKKIYIFIDGPKESSDSTLINQTIKITKQAKKNNPLIKFYINISSKNLGLQKSIISGLSKVFKKEPAAIILEDDCIPSPDFFPFTKQMLTKYKNNSKIMSITGTSLNTHTKFGYNFSKYAQCWGWATWSRAWKDYDFFLSEYKKKNQSTWLKKIWKNPLARWYWKNIFTLTKNKVIDTWCYQWTYAHIKNKGLAIIPSVNLITNIGFDAQATHTKVKSTLAEMKTKKLDFPLKHPKKIKENNNLSKEIENKFYLNPIVILGLLRYKLKSFLKN